MNQKTTRTQDPSRDAPSAATRAPAGANPARAALRGMSYEEGREALSPGQNVRGGASAATEKVEGSLWPKGPDGRDLMPSPDDVHQGQVGDCFLLSVLAGMANARPQRIKDMIRDQGNGIYTVTFDGIGFFRAARQTVSADFTKGKHARVGSFKALWPLVIEKAYANQKGGIDAIDKGGNPGRAAKELYDEGPSRLNPRSTDDAVLLGRLAAAKEKKAVMTASSEAQEASTAEQRKMADDDPGLHFGHAYTILDVDKAGRRIRLRNPWGYSHPCGSGWMSVEGFRKFYVEVNIND
jgi:hypothetical protein